MLAMNNLTGFGGAASGVLSSFAFVNSGTGNGPTITIPSGFAAGDLCVILNHAYNTSNTDVATVTPSGFTVDAEDSDMSAGEARGMRGIISHKVLNGSETTVTGMNGSVEDWIVLVFRPNAPILTVTANDVETFCDTIGPTAFNITATGGALPKIVVGQMGSDGAISPRTTTPAMTEVAGTATSHYGHYTIYNAAPADQAYDMDDEGGLNMMEALYYTFT